MRDTSHEEEVGFVALVTIDVDGPATQRALIDMLARDVEAWVRKCPGFLSANYHVSIDGTRVVNYAEWESEESYRRSFDLNPSKTAMRTAIQELPGVLDGPKMTGFALDRRIVR
jgi:C-6 monooxygenase